MVVGLTGPNAAGKGEVAAWLGRRGYAYHSLSDLLRETLEAASVPPTRENLIAEGNALRARHGPGALAERVLARLTGRDIVDSIRNPAEVEVLRSRPDFVLLGVDAPVRERFRRAAARGRPGDGPTLEEFRSKEARENSADPSRQQLARTFALADETVMNDGTLADLHAALETIIARIEGRGDGRSR